MAISYTISRDVAVMTNWLTTHPVLGGRWRTPVDSDQPVHAVPAEAMRVSLCLRDEEAAGSNPATPTEKFQVDGMIVARGGHAIDHLLAIRWRDRTSAPGMRRGGSAETVTLVRHRLSRIERLPYRYGKPGRDETLPSFVSRAQGSNSLNSTQTSRSRP